MIRTITERIISGGAVYAEMFGKSTDSKPVAGLVTGSKFTEVDTGDEYLFDETSGGTWTKVKAGYVEPAEGAEE